ncbi:large ribosomal subunit protein uL23m [Phlebotomus argentipes]|uniref:large ribosomal subunit protein uL23m n=1 Tax=Phlebotomus argentipes TaxID=94469 RepID=UPI0028935C5A|nr:large ribosomal subunit protein uL23m [Phlebotomus argentipes]
MSTRWYPIYQRGNPQLRVFLPNFWMKIVRPELKQPKNVVQFSCSLEMTKHDIRNYLEKIYKIPVVDVRTRIAMGKTSEDPDFGFVKKAEDQRLVYVTLPKDMTFEFPNIFPEEKKDKLKEEKSLDEAKNNHKKFLERNKSRPSVPGWYSI